MERRQEAPWGTPECVTAARHPVPGAIAVPSGAGLLGAPALEYGGQ